MSPREERLRDWIADRFDDWIRGPFDQYGRRLSARLSRISYWIRYGSDDR